MWRILTCCLLSVVCVGKIEDGELIDDVRSWTWKWWLPCIHEVIWHDFWLPLCCMCVFMSICEAVGAGYNTNPAPFKSLANIKNVNYLWAAECNFHYCYAYSRSIHVLEHMHAESGTSVNVKMQPWCPMWGVTYIWRGENEMPFKSSDYLPNSSGIYKLLLPPNSMTSM